MTPPRTSVPIYCADRARYDLTKRLYPRAASQRERDTRQPPHRIEQRYPHRVSPFLIGRAQARHRVSPEGWYCDWCGAKVSVAW